jgi:hypothetical protein
VGWLPDESGLVAPLPLPVLPVPLLPLPVVPVFPLPVLRLPVLPLSVLPVPGLAVPLLPWPALLLPAPLPLCFIMSRLPVPPIPLPVSPTDPLPLGSFWPGATVVSDPLEPLDLPESEPDPLPPDESPVSLVRLRPFAEPLLPLGSFVSAAVPPGRALPAPVEVVPGDALVPALAPPGWVDAEPEPAGPVAPVDELPAPAACASRTRSTVTWSV